MEGRLFVCYDGHIMVLWRKSSRGVVADETHSDLQVFNITDISQTTKNGSRLVADFAVMRTFYAVIALYLRE